MTIFFFSLVFLFVCLTVFSFPLHSYRIVSLDIELKVDSSFVSALKKYCNFFLISDGKSVIHIGFLCR